MADGIDMTLDPFDERIDEIAEALSLQRVWHAKFTFDPYSAVPPGWLDLY